MIITSLVELNKIALKPFQIITLFSGYNQEHIHKSTFDYLNEINNKSFECFYYFNRNEKKIIVDIQYHLTDDEIIYLNWNFTKQRCNDLELTYLDEIFSDSIINTGLSGNILNIKDSFNYHEILISTMKYYHTVFDEPILLRIDNYKENMFFIYNGE